MLITLRLSNLLLSSLFLAGLAHAAEFQRHFDGNDVALMGMGLYEYLGKEIYLGALYGNTAAAEVSAQTVHKVQIRVLTDSLSARRFNRLWLDAFALNTEREERSHLSDENMAFGEMLDRHPHGNKFDRQVLELTLQVMSELHKQGQSQQFAVTLSGNSLKDDKLIAWISTQMKKSKP